MPIFKRIICPIDFSPPSLRCLATCVELAGMFDAELILVHVVSPLPSISDSPASVAFHLPQVTEQLIQEAGQEMHKLQTERVPAPIRLQSRVIEGKPADEIVRLAEQESADLIVMATHGDSPIQRILIGSVTERVVRTARCPVLTIRPD